MNHVDRDDDPILIEVDARLIRDLVTLCWILSADRRRKTKNAATVLFSAAETRAVAASVAVPARGTR